MKILMVSTECVPFAKAGGLADVVPALASALGRRGHDVKILMPRYRCIPREGLIHESDGIGVRTGCGGMDCSLYSGGLEGGPGVWMLDREDLYDREGLYGPDGSNPWGDNALRFAVLSSSVFAVCRAAGWIPDILHLHDWPAAPAAWMLKATEGAGEFGHTASVLTVHNLGYQGMFDSSEASVFGEEAGDFGSHPMIHNDLLNFLAGGLRSADAVTAVSPTYAREILSPEFSAGLGEILDDRRGCITGILNGMDYDAWNPARDGVLRPYNYDRGSLGRKRMLKARLQRESGLPVNGDVPLFGMVGRLTGQKGVDLIDRPDRPALGMFREGSAQLVLLGSGEGRYEEALRAVGKALAGRCAVRIGFSDSYARLIEGGSDFFVMPSRYEPCGLNQMYSLRYGTLPVARRTGGLADTVVDAADGKEGCGFLFENADSGELGRAMERAAAFYSNRRAMRRMRRRGMALRFEWAAAAAKYENIYRGLIP